MTQAEEDSNDPFVEETALAAQRACVLELARQLGRPGVQDEDLVQAGFLGVLMAAKCFDVSVGTPFDVYACWWARSKMQEVLDMAQYVVEPPERECARALRMRVERMSHTLRERLGRSPTDDELIAALGAPAGEVALVRNKSGQRATQTLHHAPTSIDWTLGPDAGELAGRSEYSASLAGRASVDEPYAPRPSDPPSSDGLGRYFLARAAQQPLDAMDHPAAVELEGTGERHQARTGELYMRTRVSGAEDRADRLITHLPMRPDEG
jgi:hypothetical protein